jgi:chromosome segregation ATPase
MKLFKIKDLQKFGLAIESVAGGNMYNVVVRTANAAKELLQNNAVPFRVTYIPLDKIDGR